MNTALSSLRAQLRDLTQQLEPLREIFLKRQPLLPGSLYTLRRRCGKSNCRCAEGQLHATTVLSYRGGARPQTITPTPQQLGAVKQATDAYRRFRRARAELVKLHRQMMQVIDAIEAQRVREGNQKFHTLRAKTDAPASSPMSAGW